MDAINKYYSKRAQEYEQIYQRADPIRQSEQNKIAEEIKKIFCDKNVLEVACGTGFWTFFLSETAKEIVATDNSDEVIEIAKSKSYKCPVFFKKCDAYNLPFSALSFNGGQANFWFSHIPKHKIELFLDGFHRVLSNQAIVFIADNVFNEDIGGKLVRDKGNDNTYKIRFLENGDKYKILKNYYSEKELVNIFSRYGNLLNMYFGNCFWYLYYEVK
jgi:ubiquinone/menaquinone biosynthesis C-methylase UbiE